MESQYRSVYGSIGSAGAATDEKLQKPNQYSSLDDFDSTSYKAMWIDDMNDSIVFQINELAMLRRKDGTPVRNKIHIQNPLRVPRIIRRRSETDLLMMKDFEISMEEESRTISKLHTHVPTKISESSDVPTKFSTQQYLVLISISIIDFITYGALSIMAPFFPNEASKKGVNQSMSGFVFSVYALVIFISSPFMGRISDKIGCKSLLLGGLFLTGVCNILFGLLYYAEDTLTFLGGCIIIRSLEGLGAAAFVTAGFTFVAEIFPDNIGSILGICEIFVGLGMSCGPAIGGLLYDWGGYGLPFYCVGGLLLLIVPFNFIVLPSIGSSQYQKGSTRRLLQHKPVILMTIVILVVSIIWGFTEPTLEPHLREFNLSAKHLGLFFLLASATYAFSSPGWGFIADKLDETWILMVLGLLFSSGSLILLGPSRLTGLENSIWLNAVALTLLGISMSMALLPTFEAMLDYAIEDGHTDGSSTYALIGGLWSSAYSLGDVIGPMLGAFLTHHFGFPLCTTAMAGICLFTALIVFSYFQFVYIPPPAPSQVSEGNSEK